MLGATAESSMNANNDPEANETTLLLHGQECSSTSSDAADDNPKILIRAEKKSDPILWSKTLSIFHQLIKELKAPPVLAAIAGFVVGAISWLRNLIIGQSAPFRAINDSITLLGDGTIPCITLILGGNLTQGLCKARLQTSVVIAIICVRYLILPIIGIGVVKGASRLGFLLSDDPLYCFILMMQFALPPGINIGTMTQLFEVAQEECSMINLWTYLVAAFALTGWSIVFMSILS